MVRTCQAVSSKEANSTRTTLNHQDCTPAQLDLTSQGFYRAVKGKLSQKMLHGASVLTVRGTLLQIFYIFYSNLLLKLYITKIYSPEQVQTLFLKLCIYLTFVYAGQEICCIFLNNQTTHKTHEPNSTQPHRAFYWSGEQEDYLNNPRHQEVREARSQSVNTTLKDGRL